MMKHLISSCQIQLDHSLDVRNALVEDIELKIISQLTLQLALDGSLDGVLVALGLPRAGGDVAGLRHSLAVLGCNPTDNRHSNPAKNLAQVMSGV